MGKGTESNISIWVERYLQSSDDVLMHGSSVEEHGHRLRKGTQGSSLTFNSDKTKIGLTEIDYVGNTISKDGLKLNEDRIMFNM